MIQQGLENCWIGAKGDGSTFEWADQSGFGSYTPFQKTPGPPFPRSPIANTAITTNKNGGTGVGIWQNRPITNKNCYICQSDAN